MDNGFGQNLGLAKKRNQSLNFIHTQSHTAIHVNVLSERMLGKKRRKDEEEEEQMRLENERLVQSSEEKLLQLCPIKTNHEIPFRSNETLENIVRIQGDLIRDLQKRVTILEEALLEKHVSKLAIK